MIVRSVMIVRRRQHDKGGYCSIHGGIATKKRIPCVKAGPRGKKIRSFKRKHCFECDLGPRGQGVLRQTKLSFSSLHRLVIQLAIFHRLQWGRLGPVRIVRLQKQKDKKCTDQTFQFLDQMNGVETGFNILFYMCHSYQTHVLMLLLERFLIKKLSNYPELVIGIQHALLSTQTSLYSHHQRSLSKLSSTQITCVYYSNTLQSTTCGGDQRVIH